VGSFEELVQEYMMYIEIMNFDKDVEVFHEGRGYPGVCYVLSGTLSFKSAVQGPDGQLTVRHPPA
jgi:hypothetical protein